MPNPSKLSLFPLNTAVDPDGHLTLHGHRLTTLAAQHGTPLYVYDLATIRHQIAAYRQGLAAYPGPTRLTYAGKAFLCTALVRWLTQLGVGLDVASAGELFIAQQGGADPGQIHLHGNNKTTRDLRAALKAKIGHIVIDNEAELDRLTALAANQPAPVNVWLRVTPGIAVETHRYIQTGATDSKFGLSLPDAQQIAQRLVQAEAQSPLRLTGLHLHLGSHFHDAEPVAEAVEQLLDLAMSLREDFDWELKELCPGGGWGVRYHPDDPPKPVEPFVGGLVEAVTIACRRRGLPLPELVLEPGRSLVAQAGLALYEVGGRKVIPRVRTYVSIDGGLADNPRPALYGAGYTALLANRATAAEVETVAIAGPFCESGDVMIQAVDLPLARPGDILAVPVAGAYHLSMSSNYNAALRPAVLFVEETGVTLAQRRETFEDLVGRDQ